MTVQELYNWAIENKCLDAILKIEVPCDVTCSDGYVEHYSDDANVGDISKQWNETWDKVKAIVLEQ